MAVLMKKNNQLINVGYSIKQGESVQNKLPSVADGTITTITAEDMQGVTSIRKYAFAYCTDLTSLTIPNTVTNIGDFSFYNCSGLTSITIPSSVTDIGSNVFNYCTGVNSITVEATTPPTLTASASFSHTNNCPIYVPAESLSAYQSAANWSTWASRIEAIPT